MSALLFIRPHFWFLDTVIKIWVLFSEFVHICNVVFTCMQENS